MHNALGAILLSMPMNGRLLLGMTEMTQLTDFCQLIKFGHLMDGHSGQLLQMVMRKKCKTHVLNFAISSVHSLW